MAKKVQIHYSSDYQHVVIGIASDTPIWKLCYEINQLLDLNLTQRDPDDLSTAQPSAEDNLPLFKKEGLSQPQTPQGFYEDSQSHPRTEFALFPGNRSNLPPEAKPFRFFLLIRSLETPPPDIADMIGRLKRSELILSAVDVSHIKHINRIIP